MDNVINIKTGREYSACDTHPISVGLRNQSAHFHQRLMPAERNKLSDFGAITKDQYILLLQAHLFLRRALEKALPSPQSAFQVKNILTGAQFSYSAHSFLCFTESRSIAIENDLVALTGCNREATETSLQAAALARYIQQTQALHSAALLGILFTFEDPIAFCGNELAHTLNRNLRLGGEGISYFQGSAKQRQDFLHFVHSLDKIQNTQTQFNILTASKRTYEMYCHLFPWASSAKAPTPQRQSR